jgi:2-methylisocitrate lyase-like PEP mutase family enzyme
MVLIAHTLDAGADVLYAKQLIRNHELTTKSKQMDVLNINVSAVGYSCSFPKLTCVSSILTRDTNTSSLT